jgi:hypothetical protein
VPPGAELATGSRAKADGERAENQLAVSMLVTFIVVLATYLVARFAVPALHIREESALTFLPEVIKAGDLDPQPVANQQYLLVVAATLGLPLTIALAASYARPALLCVARRLAPFLLFELVVLLVVAAIGAVPQAVIWWPREVGGSWIFFLAATLLGAFVLFGPLRALLELNGTRWELAVALVMLVATALLCLSGLYTNHMLNLAPGSTSYHFPFTFEEVYAVVGGHTPLVDWVPQYVTVIPYLLAPFLSLAPPSIGVFTLAMTALSIAALMCGYFALRLLARRPIPAMLLYLPFLALTLLPGPQGTRNEVFTAADYFALMPMRYAGPLACFAAVAAMSRWKPRIEAWVLFGALEGFVALNNFEFGFPAAVAGVIAVVLAQNPSQRLELRHSLRRVGLTLAGVAVAIALFSATTVLRSGSLPQFDDLVLFNREFALAGFLELPLHGLVTLQGLVFVTFVAAVALGVAPALHGSARDGIEGRLSTATLTFTGIFGLGAFAFYANERPLPAVLGATFCAWGLALAALVVPAVWHLRRWRTAPMAATLAALPVLALAIVGLGSILQDDYAFAQPARVLGGGTTAAFDGSPFGAIDAVRSCLRPGSNVGLLMPYGLWIAIEGHVHDWFPFNNPGDLATVQQVDTTLSDLRAHNARVIVSQQLPASVDRLITGAGFRPVFDDTAVPALFWVRGSRRQITCD